MPDVFISYSRQDRPLAEAIAADLGSRGFEVWWDIDLLGGEDYRKKTQGVIERARSAIVIWSRRSVESEWVIGEASAARERKILIPVCVDGATPPLDFRPLNTIDLSGWLPGDPLPDMLIKALSEKCGREFNRPPGVAAANDASGARFSRMVARSWYSDFECLLFSFMAQGFATVLTNIPLAIHHEELAWQLSAGIALLTSTISAAIIMRPAVMKKRLPVAMAWLAVAILTGVAGYFVVLALWQILSINEFLTFVGFWSLGLVFLLDVARRSAQ